MCGDGICAIYVWQWIEFITVWVRDVLHTVYYIMYPYIGKCNLLPENEGIYSYR